jgi:hypothetical protein
MFTVKRIAVRDEGAFGVMLHHGVPFAVTLERTYEQPTGQLVKIAPGQYTCTRSRYLRGNYDTFEIHVPGHTRILFHKANWEHDLEGCIGIGENYAVLKDKTAIAQSDAGFTEFMKRAQGVDQFPLNVIHCGG